MDKQKKREETLKIISLLRERELLWNTNCFSYRRKDLKKKAWEEIGRECNMTGESVKKKLKSLRSTYIIEKKKVDQSRKSGCDADDVYEPSLHWYGEMSFLDTSISTRKSKDNVFDNNLNESIYSDEAAISKSYDSDISFTPSTSSKRKREDDINTDKFDEAIAKIVNISKPKIDAFSTFAESMAITLRGMPEEIAYLTMKDIQDLLFQRKFNKAVAATNTEFEKSETALQPHIFIKNVATISTEFDKRETLPPDTCDSETLFLTMSDAVKLENDDSFLS